MSVYAIGDIQGCYDALMRLLEKIDFDPVEDKLWFAGDLVNRGKQSLEVLRFVKGLGDRAVNVLGNHDLHLLAVAAGNGAHLEKDHTLDPILNAPDRDELIAWLRHCPLMHHSKKRRASVIHAGLPPQWSIAVARERAREVEAVLQSDGCDDFLHQMYGNKPDCWSDDLEGIDRLRFITNCFTRLRYCDPEGVLALREKGAPGSQKGRSLPWYQVPGRASRSERILFGHWSTLGYRDTDNVVSLDSGCIWKGKLTAVKVRIDGTLKPYQVACNWRRKKGIAIQAPAEPLPLPAR